MKAFALSAKHKLFSAGGVCTRNQLAFRYMSPPPDSTLLSHVERPWISHSGLDIAFVRVARHRLIDPIGPEGGEDAV